jgi:hypothetical protein
LLLLLLRRGESERRSGCTKEAATIQTPLRVVFAVFATFGFAAGRHLHPTNQTTHT